MTPEANFRLLCVTDKHAETGAEFLAFSYEVVIAPDTVLENIVWKRCVWSVPIRKYNALIAARVPPATNAGNLVGNSFVS